MTDQEFSQFAKRLFVEYPSLYEWLQRNSPDAQATQRAWRDRLREYTFAECAAVLDDWQTGALHPFAAYERDQVPMIIRSVVDNKRAKKARQQRAAEQRRQFKERRKRNRNEVAESSIHGTIHEDSENLAVMNECQPMHLKMKRGEISKEDYMEFFEASWSKHVKPVMQELEF